MTASWIKCDLHLGESKGKLEEAIVDNNNPIVKRTMFFPESIGFLS